MSDIAKYAFREEYGHVEEITSFGIGDDCLRIGIREPLDWDALVAVVSGEYHGVRVEIVVTGDIRKGVGPGATHRGVEGRPA